MLKTVFISPKVTSISFKMNPSNSSFFMYFLCFSHGYAFLAASELSGDINKFVDNIEDVVAQADEVDDKYLQVIFTL